MISGMVLAGCGAEEKTAAESAPPSRQGTIATNFEAKFLDAEPAMSADGMRVVFASGRDTERTQRIFRVDRAGTGTPEALTGEENFGTEYLPTLSPDGQWVSFAAIKDGVTKLYVTGFDGASRVEVTLPEMAGVAPNGLRFSTGAAPLLAVQYETVGRTRALAVVKLTTAAGVISAADAVVMGEVGANESMPRWTKNSPFEFVTMARQVADSRFVARSFADATVASVTRSEEGVGALSDMLEMPFFAVGDDRFYVGKLSQGSRVVTPTGDLTKEDGTSAVGEVVVKNEVRRFRNGQSPSSLSSQQFNVLAVDGTPDGGAVVSLGTEYFACKHKQFYGTTLLVHGVASTKNARLLPVWNAEQKTWSVSSEPCALITAENRGAKLVDATAQRIEVAGTATQVSLVYQSFFFGDPEILHMTFDWDGTAATNVVVTNLSNNHSG